MYSEESNSGDLTFKCGLGFCGVALLCSLISFVTPYWLVALPEFPSTFIRLGLWEACFNGYVHPEDYVSKAYYGCWYVYYPEYKYIRDWLNPPWFYAVQMMSSLALFCNSLALIIVGLKGCSSMDRNDKKTNVIAIIMLIIASCCYIISTVTMGVMSKDREWMPRPDHNRPSFSFALAVIAGFFSIFAVIALVSRQLVVSLRPEIHAPLIRKFDSDFPPSHFGGSSGHLGGQGTLSSATYSPYPAGTMQSVTSAATVSAKHREAFEQQQQSRRQAHTTGSTSSYHAGSVV